MPFPIRRGGRSIRRSGLCLALLAGLSTAASADVTVNTGTTGPVYGDGGTFTVTAAGSISGGSQGVIAQLPNSGITILANSGTIQGSNGIENYGAITTLTNDGRVNGLGDWGIYTGAGHSLGALTNSGTISAANHGYGLYGTSDSLTNQAGGLIAGTSGYALYLSGTFGTVSNAGTITSDYRSIINLGTLGSVTNSGLVSAGNDWNFLNYGSLNSITNSGTFQSVTNTFGLFATTGTLANQTGGLIQATNGFALYIDSPGSLTTLTNAGTIASVNHRSIYSGTYIGTFTNSGLVTTGGDYNFLAYGSVGTITNSGTFQGPTNVFGLFSTTGTLANQAGGVIQATNGYAVYVESPGSLGTLTNAGTIASTNNRTIYNSSGIGTFTNSGLVTTGADWTFLSYGSLGVLTNSGTIQGPVHAIGIYGASGTIANQAGGSMSGGTGNGVYFSSTGSASLVSNAGQIGGVNGVQGDAGSSIGTLTNSGTIAGSASGIRNAGVLSTVSNSGLLKGDQAFVNLGSVSSLDNSGLISGTGGNQAIYQNGYGTIVTLTNSGTITHTTTGIESAGTINDFTNSALVSGFWGVVSTGVLGSVDNSGKIVGSGNIGLFSSNTLGTLTNSGTVQGLNTGLYLVGNSGTITNAAGALIAGTNQEGIYVRGSVTSLSNAGTIAGGTGYPDAGLKLVSSGTIGMLANTASITGQSGVQLNSTSGIGSLVNSGTIHGTSDGIQHDSSGSIGSLVNQAGALIRGDGDAGIDGGGFGTLDNAGTIVGANGIYHLQNGAIGTFINRSTGIVSGTGSGYGFYSSRALGSFTNEAGGLIQSTNRQAVYLVGNGVGTFANAGVIRTLNDQNHPGVYVGDDIVTFTNSGTISGYYGVEQDDLIGTLTNTATGLLKGTYSGLYVSSSDAMTVVNYGQIVGGQKGVYGYYDLGPLTNKSGGVISGTAVAGITIEDDARTVQPTITNEAGGLVTSANGAGVLVSASGYTPGTIVNDGRIEGATGGVRIAAGGLKWVANTGTIAYTGTGTGPAVFVGPGRVLGVASGTAGPAIVSTGSGALLAGTIENQGTVHYGFTIDNQNVTVSAGGGAGTFTSGTLQVTDGNLTFTGGTLTLGADVSVDGGSGTFTNEATLRMLGIENVTGNFQQTSGGTVLMELLGTGSGQYGQMNVSGAATFAGGLALGDTGLTGGLADGQLFQLFGFGSYTGGFSGLSVNGTSLSSLGGGEWLYGTLKLTEQWTSTTMSLVVSSSGVPEIDPASAGSVLSLVVGALAMAERRLRRGRREG